MAIISFDGEKRRDTREPQTTKTELLRQPLPASDPEFATDMNTPRSTAGLIGVHYSNTTWDFNAIGANATPSLREIAQVKQEMTLPIPERANHKRQRTPTDTPHEPQSKRAKARALAARQTSDERFGRRTGVIDLTLDDSSSDEEDDGQPFPERQYVPGANDEPSTPLLTRRMTPSPPRTFTRGLSPIAAHRRQPPIVHRSKPPIKPGNRRQTPLKVSPPSTNRQVFKCNTPRPLTPLNNNNTSPSTASISGSTQFSQPAALRRSTANSSTTPITQKSGGPFVDDDEDSDNEEESTTTPRERAVSRTSVGRLIGRPRFDTPKRVALAKMLEESRTMRGTAHERLPGETGNAAGTPICADSDQKGVDQSQISTQSSEDQSFLGIPRPR